MNEKEEKIRRILKERNMTFESIASDTDEKAEEPCERFKKLMDIYFTLKVTADMEMPYWYNRIWQENNGEITEVRRAKAVAQSYARTTPTILPWEKLVMNKTKNIRGAFPFPWVTASFFNAQAEALMSEVDEPALSEADNISRVGTGGGNVTSSYGEVISIAKKFGMRKEDIPVLVKVSKDWVNASVESLSTQYAKMLPQYDQYKSVMDSVVCMFDSYAIPQGREQINYYLPLEYGFDGIIAECDKYIKEFLGEAGDDGILGMSRGYYYVAVKETAKGLSKWCENYANKAKELAKYEPDQEFKKNYEEIAEVMSNIAHKKPESFREALQLTLCLHLGVVNEDPQSGQSIGRLGQILEPFYQKDLREGKITEEGALELLELYRIKITCIECFASAGVSGGVLSGNTFNNLSLGGLGYDGLSAVTPLEYLIVEAGIRAQTPQPTLSLLYDEKTPESFVLKCAECIKKGNGYPAIMNNQGGMNFMLRNFGSEGMDIVDARAWAPGGCLESAPGVFKPLHYDGKTWMIPGGASPTCGTGIHFIAMPKVLELVLTNGIDQRTGKMVFPPHDTKIESYEKLIELWGYYMDLCCNAVNKVNNLQMDIWRKQNMPAVQSMLKGGFGTNHQHLGNCGAKYNAGINFESCGTITLINSLASIKKNVFEEKNFTLDELKEAMINNFGYKTAYETNSFSSESAEVTETVEKYRRIHALCLNSPKYGNDEHFVDDILVGYEQYMFPFVHKYHSYYGKPLYMCQISVSTHGPQGYITLARADGTLAGTTYADGSVSAAPGTDVNGVYALFNSATCYDHSLCQNTQMNLKLHPSSVKGQKGTKRLVELIRAYMRKGGFHVQFNVVTSETLRDAQEKPENYRDLMVRVAGFTQYWCEIGKPIQDEVIHRTEYDEL